ncbi:MAG: alkaline phosphatase family protein [Niabella sp.]|nr:alkaline phosphatase family protein [Niabella sp.]
MKHGIYAGAFCLAAVLAGAFFQGCKKYPSTPQIFDQPDSAGKQRKVLVITIDGVSGSELLAAKLTNITALQQNAKYSYNESKTPKPGTDGASWATLLTGRQPLIHGITDSSLEYNPAQPVVPPVNRVPFANTIFTLLRSNRPGNTTAIITPWDRLAKYAGAANYQYSLSADANVRDSSVSLLNRDDKLGLMVVDFNGASLAGKATGVYAAATNPDYKTALSKADGYIGDIMTALKARKNYNKESWLVMVTTNPGGNTNPLPGFFLCSYPGCVSSEVKKTGFTTAFFNSDTTTYAYVPNDNGLYDCKLGQEFTIQVRMYNLDGKQYPAILSKSTSKIDNSYYSIKGWMWLNVNSGSVRYEPNFGSGDIKADQAAFTNAISVNQWHTYTMTITNTSATTRRSRLYVDGVPAGGDINIASTASGHSSTNIDFSNPAEPLKLGYRMATGGPAITANHAMSFYAADLVYFNKSLPDSIVKNYINLTDYTRHPYFKNLTGWWPLDEGTGDAFNNYAPGGYDMALNGTYRWIRMDPNVPPGRTASPDGTASIPTAATDVVSNIVYWMGIKGGVGGIAPSWLSNFSTEIK